MVVILGVQRTFDIIFNYLPVVGNGDPGFGFFENFAVVAAVVFVVVGAAVDVFRSSLGGIVVKVLVYVDPNVKS